METLEVNHHFKNGGSFWMINCYLRLVVRKPTLKKWWLDFHGKYRYEYLIISMCTCEYTYIYIYCINYLLDINEMLQTKNSIPQIRRVSRVMWGYALYRSYQHHSHDETWVDGLYLWSVHETSALDKTSLINCEPHLLCFLICRCCLSTNFSWSQIQDSLFGDDIDINTQFPLIKCRRTNASLRNI